MLKFYVLQEPTVRLALSKFGSNGFFLSLPHMLLGFEVFLLRVRVNIRVAFKDWSEPRARLTRTDGNEETSSTDNNRTSVSRCCFHCFQVSLVKKKITQINE